MCNLSFPTKKSAKGLPNVFLIKLMKRGNCRSVSIETYPESRVQNFITVQMLPIGLTLSANVVFIFVKRTSDSQKNLLRPFYKAHCSNLL